MTDTGRTEVEVEVDGVPEADVPEADVHELHDPLADRLTGAAAATPTWRPFTAEAMQVVHRRARRRQATERVISVACGLFAIAIAATTIAALDGGDGDRTLRTAEQPESSAGEEDPLADPNTTSTTRPSFSFDGRESLPRARAEVTASTPVGTSPPLATPTTGPTPSTTAPRMTDTQPPSAFAALNGVEIEAMRGPSCWERGGKTTCDEKGRHWFEDAPALDGIQSGSSLWFRWAVAEQPKEIVVTSYFATVNAQPETEECKGGNPCRIEFGAVTFGTDPRWYVIETRWEHGSVWHAIKLRSHPVEPR